jgi:hypothetical protein
MIDLFWAKKMNKTVRNESLDEGDTTWNMIFHGNGRSNSPH